MLFSFYFYAGNYENPPITIVVLLRSVIATVFTFLTKLIGVGLDYESTE